MSMKPETDLLKPRPNDLPNETADLIEAYRPIVEARIDRDLDAWMAEYQRRRARLRQPPELPVIPIPKELEVMFR